MKSQTVSKDKGFTMIEVMVVIAIIGAIFAMSAFMDSTAFTRESISDEEATLVSILQKARSRAMNNIEHEEHGVHIETDNYIIFKDSYVSGDSSNEEIGKNNKLTFTGLNEVRFAQLSGEPYVTGDIIIGDGINTKTITITKGGLIDW